ncbi:MAG TPA: NnrS family protein [Rhodocyclaceae bacterium]|nr:NnrS family protein [Rhodocyclaceae bacterium]
MKDNWPILFAAPHRGMFAAGMAQGLLAMGLWTLDLAGRYAGLWSAPVWPLPPSWLHSLMLIYGVFPFFIFGFILTAGPRWQKQPDTGPAVFRPAVLLMAGGWLVADIGLAVPMLLPTGLLLVLAGWCVATVFLWRLTLAGSGDRMHIGFMAAAQTAGAIGLTTFGVLTAGGSFWLGPLAIALGLWGYLLPVFLIVVHRMLPFFSQSVIPRFQAPRPTWALYLMLVGSLGHGLLGFLDLSALAWLVDLPAAFAAFRLTQLWRLRDSFAAKILAVLHVAFAWAGIGFSLLALDGMLRFAGLPGLGLAPVHALTLGFLSSALIGMASRVTLGHAGRPIVGDNVMWGCFWAMQITAMLRVAGEFWSIVNPLAALLWLTNFAIWTWHYAPAYWRPREDGQSG